MFFLHFIETHILSFLIWLPVLGSIVALSCNGDRYPQRARIIGLMTSILSLLLCIPLCIGFNIHTAAMQWTEHHTWVTPYYLYYDLGLDGISLPLVLLTVFTTFIIVLSSWTTVQDRVAQYIASFLIMQGMVIGVFCALDSILFYLFWEGMLIPMYLNIGIWGSSNRSYASIKFFLFTFLGSALMLVALLYLGFLTKSFYILHFYDVPLNMQQQMWIFIAFFLGFAVKVPMWPLHTWLPDAHTEAPIGGSVVLAALMLKLGAYGFLRFSLPITPDASVYFSPYMMALSLIAIIYIGFIAIAQQDMKRLIAYSSIAHMGFVVLGIFSIYSIVRITHNTQGAVLTLEGSMIQMVTHAFGSGSLFLGVGVLYKRLHTRLMRDYQGVAHSMPIFATLFMLFVLSNIALPGTAGFIGEFLIILGILQAHIGLAVLASMTLILGAAYTLLMYKRVFWGPLHPKAVLLKDLDTGEFIVFTILGLGVIFLGVYPQPLLNILQESILHLLNLSLQSKL